VPSANLKQTAECDGNQWTRVTDQDGHFVLRGPLPSGWVRVRFRAWAQEPGVFKFFSEVPGPKPFEREFNIGLVGPEEGSFSAFVFLNEKASRVTIVPSGNSLPFAIRNLVLTRVSKLEIVLTSVLAIIGRQKISPRYILNALGQLQSIFKADGLRGLRAWIARTVDSQTQLRDRYQDWITRNTPSQSQVDALRARSAELPYKPLFSVIIPALHTSGSSLGRCIRSITDQAYPFWELCVVSAEPLPDEVLTEIKSLRRRAKVLHTNRQGPAPDVVSTVTGEFVCIVRDDAIMAPEALGEYALYLNNHPEIDALYCDEDRIDAQNRRSEPFFKPDWSPEYLESFPYFSSLTCYRTDIVRKTAWLDEWGELDSHYDLALRFTALTQAVAHIPKVLCHRSRSEVEEANHEGKTIDRLKHHLDRLGTRGTVALCPFPDLFDVRHEIIGTPLISIIIIAGGKTVSIRGKSTDLLHNCINSICGKSEYGNYEIIVVHDGNLDAAALNLLETSNAKLVAFEGKFNFSTKINLGARNAQGEHLLFLNDDCEVISPDWLSVMLQFSQRKGVGVVGAKLYFEDGTIQHAGVTLTRAGFPHHLSRSYPGSSPGYFYSLVANRNCLAVTGACLMTRRDVFEEVGGFNQKMPVNYNDIDYCLKARRAGYRAVVAMRAELFHYESKSRSGRVTRREMDYFARLWHGQIKQDPYYNINLEPDSSTFEVRIDP
jgi:O-antigen biosynthesis protein